MIAFLNENDLTELEHAVIEWKGVNFIAAKKMELLVEAYREQQSGETELEKYQEQIEELPGYVDSSGHFDHLKDTSDMLKRALDEVSGWEDAKDDEPLDEAVKRLVLEAERPDPAAGIMEAALTDIIAAVDAGESDALIQIRNLASAALP